MRHVCVVLVSAALFGLMSFYGFSNAKAKPQAKRAACTTSRVKGSPDPPLPYVASPKYSRVELKQPIAAHVLPGTQKLLVAQLSGEIYSVSLTDESATPELFWDGRKALKDLKRIYDFTFHPDFATNGQVFLTYTVGNNVENGTRVSRFRLRRVKATESGGVDPQRDRPADDPGFRYVWKAESEQILLSWWAGGHNGGCLRFGPDGYLYISTGDGTAPSPPDGKQTGQDCRDLLSSILRIDIDRTQAGLAYAIPADNPFVNRAGIRPEIYAFGFRNPWKMDFDTDSGSLWVGDVGWELWEMVYRVEKAGNYGWSVMEGPQLVQPNAPRGPSPISPPAAAHPHTEARSVTGGVVYRGRKFPDLRGHYLYGDYVTGKIWALKTDSADAQPREIADTSIAIITFTTRPDGEVLIVGYDGRLYELSLQSRSDESQTFPRLLSQTGLFTETAQLLPAAGVSNYHILAEPWMDGATAQRHLALPHVAKLELYQQNNAQTGELRGQWSFPEDSVFLKTLSVPSGPDQFKRVETQMLHRHGDDWRAYTFAWNDEQSDAELVAADGLSRLISVYDPSAKGGLRKQPWRFASRTECLVCHNSRRSFVLGFKPEQLDHKQNASDASTVLQSLIALGYFDDPFDRRREFKTPREPLVDPHDSTQPLSARARAYLHVNCGHCHIQGGGGTATFQAISRIPTEKLKLVGLPPTQGTFAIYDARLVAAGDPYRSTLLYRMLTLGPGRMPHLGSQQIDTDGTRLLEQWIAQLSAADAAFPSANTTTRANVLKLRRQQQSLLGRMDTGDVSAVEPLLKSTSGSLQLAIWLHRQKSQGQSPAASRSLATIEQTLVDRLPNLPAHVQGLFEAFIPADKRTQRLGDQIDQQAILQLTGDVNRGRVLFHQRETVQCRSCHQIGQAGRSLGPPLDDVGKRLTRRQILASIVKPSAQIDPKFQTQLVQTADGQVHTGLLIRRDKQTMVLRGVDGKDVSLANDQIEQMVASRKSLMPELQLRDWTAQDVADLLAYLSTLKSASGGGTTSEEN